MLRHIRTHLSYANVMATIAVFIALGGGAYAIKIKRNSVKSKHVAPEAIKGVDADESTFDSVPNAANAANATNATSAGTVDGLDSTAFATSAALGTLQGQVNALESQLGGGTGVLSGNANPTATSAQTFFTFPGMELQVETDGDADSDDNIIVRDLTPASVTLGLVGPGGPSVIIGTQQIDEPGAFGGPLNQADAVIFEGTERLFIHCLFPTGRDVCYGIASGP